MPKHNIGTAGWSYKDWVPNFYPKNQSGGFDWLQFYSHYFNCAEVNSTYYTYISPKVLDDAAVVKRFYKKRNEIELVSENSQYKTIVIDKKYSSFKVVGIVVGIYRSMEKKAG